MNGIAYNANHEDNGYEMMEVFVLQVMTLKEDKEMEMILMKGLSTMLMKELSMVLMK